MKKPEGGIRSKSPERPTGFERIKRTLSLIKKIIEETYSNSVSITHGIYFQLERLERIMGYLNRLIIQIRNKENPFIQKDNKRIVGPGIFLEGGRFLTQEESKKFLKDFFWYRRCYLR